MADATTRGNEDAEGVLGDEHGESEDGNEQPRELNIVIWESDTNGDGECRGDLELDSLIVECDGPQRLVLEEDRPWDAASVGLVDWSSS